jgi:hypothetical protein
MIKLIPKEHLTAADIKVLRTISHASISAIRKAAATGQSIQEYRFFEGDWEDVREALKQLHDEWVDNTPPFRLIEVDDAGEDEVPISISDLDTMLKNARAIEIEQERATDLEIGYIERPEQFEPHDDDWI